MCEVCPLRSAFIEIIFTSTDRGIMFSFLFQTIDIMEPLFHSVVLYWTLDNVTQTVNIASNAINHTHLMTSVTDVTPQAAKSLGGELHFGIINDSCIINLSPNTCPGGLTVSFWLQIWKTKPSKPLKILGFGLPYENKTGFLIMEREDKVVIRVITSKYKCEIELDVVDAAWTHIAFSFRHPRLMKGYRNGEEVISSNLCVTGFNSVIAFEQPLTSGTAVAAFDEMMIWYNQLDRDAFLGMFEYSTGM